MNLIDTLQKALEENNEIYSKVCKVIAYDSSKETIDVEPIDGDTEIIEVRLIAGESKTPFICVPSVGSFVVVTFLSVETAFCSLYSEIETIKIRGDQFGGLIKIEELVKQLDIMTNRINTLYDAINKGVPIPQDGGVGFQNTMKAILSTQVQKEDFKNIENENVKHG